MFVPNPSTNRLGLGISSRKGKVVRNIYGCGGVAELKVSTFYFYSNCLLGSENQAWKEQRGRGSYIRNRRIRLYPWAFIQSTLSLSKKLPTRPINRQPTKETLPMVRKGIVRSENGLSITCIKIATWILILSGMSVINGTYNWLRPILSLALQKEKGASKLWESGILLLCDRVPIKIRKDFETSSLSTKM